MSPARTPTMLFGTPSGAFLDEFVAAGSGGLDGPTGLKFGPGGKLYVGSAATDQVLYYDGATGAFLDVFAGPEDGGLDAPLDLTLGPDGALYVSGEFDILRYAFNSQAIFTVSLSKPSAAAVSVDFSTADGSATAGSDYIAAAGTVVFDPGVITRPVIVSTIDDTEVEPDETFFVNLGNPSAAAITDGQGQGTILNDDQPTFLSIDDVTVAEGDSGTANAIFTVTAAPVPTAIVIVDYATDNATRDLVRRRAGDCCEYCLLPQMASPLLTFHVEHIIARQHVDEDVTDPRVLALVCNRCNAYKGTNLTNRRRCSRTDGSRNILNISFNNVFTKPSTALSVRESVGRSDYGARRLDRREVLPEGFNMARRIQLELLPHERVALLEWNFTIDEVRDQLEVCASSPDPETIMFTATDVRWLAGDLNHAIVKRGCRDEDIIDLSERLDYVDETSDGSLDGWY